MTDARGDDILGRWLRSQELAEMDIIAGARSSATAA
jgi:hypothetical protein